MICSAAGLPMTARAGAGASIPFGRTAITGSAPASRASETTRSMNRTPGSISAAAFGPPNLVPAPAPGMTAAKGKAFTA
jgi:hypothetical protein